MNLLGHFLVKWKTLFLSMRFLQFLSCFTLFSFTIFLYIIKGKKNSEKKNNSDNRNDGNENKKLLILNLGLIIFKSCLALIRPNGRCYY